MIPFPGKSRTVSFPAGVARLSRQRFRSAPARLEPRMLYSLHGAPTVQHHPLARMQLKPRASCGLTAQGCAEIIHHSTMLSTTQLVFARFSDILTLSFLKIVMVRLYNGISLAPAAGWQRPYTDSLLPCTFEEKMVYFLLDRRICPLADAQPFMVKCTVKGTTLR